MSRAIIKLKSGWPSFETWLQHNELRSGATVLDPFAHGTMESERGPTSASGAERWTIFPLSWASQLDEVMPVRRPEGLLSRQAHLTPDVDGDVNCVQVHDFLEAHGVDVLQAVFV